MAAIAEFLASIGFELDRQSMSEAFGQVAKFGAACAAAASGAFAGLLRIAQAEADLANASEQLGIPAQRLEELQYAANQAGVGTEALAASLAGLKKANPAIRDSGLLLEKASLAMQGMSDAAARAYAEKMGIDPQLLPMLRQGISGVAEEYRELAAVSGRNAEQAAADGKAFVQEFDKLKTVAGLVVKSVAGAFLGKMRSSIEMLRKFVMENFGKIKSVLEIIMGLALKAGNVIIAFAYRIIRVAGGVVDWFNRLSDSQKKVVVGIGLVIAAWKLLGAAFLASPIGVVITALTTLFLLIDDYMTWAEGGDSLLDWSQHAAEIESVISVLKFLWNLICAIGAGIASAIAPAIDVFKNLFSTVANIVKSIASLFYNLFMGDIGGVIEAAKGLWQAWSNGVLSIFASLVNAIKAFFTGMWASITGSFPDFGAWAGNAVKGMKDIFGRGIGWIKEKLASMTRFLPDWLKEKLGLGNVKLEDERGQDASPVNMRPVPSGPALVPSPMESERSINKNTEVRVDAKTEITVNGAQNPEAVASKVNGAQKSHAADIARHTQGAVR